MKEKFNGVFMMTILEKWQITAEELTQIVNAVFRRHKIKCNIKEKLIK